MPQPQHSGFIIGALVVAVALLGTSIQVKRNRRLQITRRVG